MRSEIRTTLAALATVAVLMGSATMALAADADPAEPAPTTGTTAPEPTTPAPTNPTPTPSTPEPTTPEPTTPTPSTPEPSTSTSRTITDAQLRWGINDESNNRAFAPGSYNFLSAGRIGDPGEGGKQLDNDDRGATWAGTSPAKRAGWSASSGNVRIEKYLGGSWTRATWAGTRTTSTGAPMSGTRGPFSNHEVVVSGGTGTVDPVEGTASIRWTGSFTVVYYSGYSFFHVSDLRLTVVDGVGTLTGTLGGFGSSMDDLTAWRALPDAPGTVLADLGRVDLSKGLGFTARPAYAKVAVDVKGQTPQARSGTGWGSFPQSFIDFQLTSGTAAYWYSSGGAADAHKVAKPVTVSYSSQAPVAVGPPSTGGGSADPVENDAPEAPAGGTPTAGSSPPPAAAVPSLAAPVAADRPVAGTSLVQVRPASTVLGARAPDDRGGPDATGAWLLGGTLLAAALLVAAAPSAYAAVRTP